MSVRLGLIMEHVASGLAAAAPRRIVTRSLPDNQGHSLDALRAGVYTVISAGIGGYNDHAGTPRRVGEHVILVIGQWQLAESATGQEIEDAEFVMMEELKEFMTTYDPPVGGKLKLDSVQQSGQLYRPLAEIRAEYRRPAIF
jgi:hypothetical protein